MLTVSYRPVQAHIPTDSRFPSGASVLGGGITDYSVQWLRQGWEYCYKTFLFSFLLSRLNIMLPWTCFLKQMSYEMDDVK